jgi:hypothetical protein
MTVIPKDLLELKHNLFPVVVAFLLSIGLVAKAASQGIVEKTYLVELVQGSELTKTVRDASRYGFETARGDWVSFKSWYTSNWTDSRVTFMTEVSPTLGVLWGFGTGEYGQKYSIDPSFRIGFVWRKDVSKTSSLSFRATTTLGGLLRETPCVADYGEIGGLQQVNCRLAASTLSPADTLRYNYNMRPYNYYFMSLQYQIYF